MARAPYYTETEDNKLLALCEDNAGKKYIELANMALKYGIIANRNPDALSQHISLLLNSCQKDESCDDIDNETTAMAILKKECNEYRRKYESVCKAVIDSCTFFEDNKRNLKFDFGAIREWMYREEPERANARIESLQLEIEGKK